MAAFGDGRDRAGRHAGFYPSVVWRIDLEVAFVDRAVPAAQHFGDVDDSSGRYRAAMSRLKAVVDDRRRRSDARVSTPVSVSISEAIVTISCGVRPSGFAAFGPFRLPNLAKLLDHRLDDVLRRCVSRGSCKCSGTCNPRDSWPSGAMSLIRVVSSISASTAFRRSADSAGIFRLCVLRCRIG